VSEIKNTNISQSAMQLNYPKSKRISAQLTVQAMSLKWNNH